MHKDPDFRQSGIFRSVFYEYLIKPRNFTNLSPCNVTLWYSIKLGTFIEGLGRGMGKVEGGKTMTLTTMWACW